MRIENGHSPTALKAADSVIRPVAQWTARGLSAIAFVVGAVAMAGWIFDQPHWRSFLASGSEMKPNAALCLMLLGLALALNRGLLAAAAQSQENHYGLYLIRLAAFLTILAAIADKNLRRNPRPDEGTH